MLIGRSPVRISFGGGGTDLPSYYEQFGGAVLSTAINKYFYTILGTRSDSRIQVISSDLRLFRNWRDLTALPAHGSGLEIPLAVLERYLQQHKPPVNVHLVYEPELLGSAGTIAVNRAWVESDPAFWILYSDVLTNTNLELMSDFHSEKNGIATLGLYRVPDPSRCGVALTDDKGIIIDFEEKPASPRSQSVFSGLMIASPDIFHYIPQSVPADIASHLLPHLVGRMSAYPIEDYVLDIGTMANYREAQVTWPGLVSTLSLPDRIDASAPVMPRQAVGVVQSRIASSG
ncbi:MAG: sugar phosphate nucleotidyltransferase [Candidatus Sulfotelmatobacter sp.]